MSFTFRTKSVSTFTNRVKNSATFTNRAKGSARTVGELTFDEVGALAFTDDFPTQPGKTVGERTFDETINYHNWSYRQKN